MHKKYMATLLALTALFFAGCASQQAITGGPKDETPPKLLSTYPADQDTNYTQGLIRLEFDEWVNVQNLQKELIIAPRTDVTYKHKVKKNVVEIQFDSALAANTTYIINFQGAIADITERNKAENLVLAFSTGSQIDTLSIAGTVTNWLAQTPAGETSVMLFEEADTALLSAGKPMYLANTDASGNFTFNNLRAGNYQIFALKEPKDKSNLQYSEQRDEWVGFLPTYITLGDSNLKNVALPLLNFDYQRLQLKKARSNKQYFEFGFNKPIKAFTATMPDSVKGKILFKQIKETLRLFNTTGHALDSFPLQLHALDSVGNAIDSTFRVSFEIPKRPASEPFDALPLPKADRKASDSVRLSFVFTKPIASFNADSAVVYAGKDTLPWPAVVPALMADTAKIVLPPYPNPLRILFKKGSFVSIESDSSNSMEAVYEAFVEENYGVVTGQIESWKTKYTIQLLNEKGEIEQEVRDLRKFQFSKVPPGKKLLRILIDDNGDGRWFQGDYKTRQLPETVLLYAKEIQVKANWEIQLDTIAF